MGQFLSACQNVVSRAPRRAKGSFRSVSRGKEMKMNLKRLNKWAAINQFYIGNKSFRS